MDYHFLSAEEFVTKIEQGDFIEYNFYAGNYYGTQKSHLAETLKNHSLVLTQIEVNGKHNLDKTGISHLAIFLLPESLDILRHRIKERGGVSEADLKERLTIAQKEIAESGDYDCRIVNAEGHLTETIEKIAKIIEPYLVGEKRVDKKS